MAGWWLSNDSEKIRMPGHSLFNAIVYVITVGFLGACDEQVQVICSVDAAARDATIQVQGSKDAGLDIDAGLGVEDAMVTDLGVTDAASNPNPLGMITPLFDKNTPLEPVLVEFAGEACWWCRDLKSTTDRIRGVSLLRRGAA